MRPTTRLAALAALFAAGLAHAQPAQLRVRQIPRPLTDTEPVLAVLNASITAISADGSTVVGRYHHFISGTIVKKSFVWRPADNTFVQYDTAQRGNVQAVDDDGSRIVFSGPTAASAAPRARVYRRSDDALLYSTAPTAGGILPIVAVGNQGNRLLGWSQRPTAPGAQSLITTALGWDNTSPNPAYIPLAVAYRNGGTTTSYEILDYTDDDASGTAVTLGRLRLAQGETPVDYSYFRIVSGPSDSGFEPPARPIRGGTPRAASPVYLGGTVAAGLVDRGGNLGMIAALWYDRATPVRIALPTGGLVSQFTDIANLGDTAVGGFTAANQAAVRPLVWSKPRGSRDLQTILARYGVTVPAGTVLRGAHRLSEDGRRITGLASVNGNPAVFHATLPASEVCYANCDGSTTVPFLSPNDVACFNQRLAAGQFYADCNNDGQYSAQDLACFLTRYNQGCP